jgi:5-methylcytosine-specific restriction protein A
MELSELLNRLPIHTVRPDLERFRNANGVALRLANFAALDPAYPGKGMSNFGPRVRAFWDHYHDHPALVASLAAQLRNGSTSGTSFPTSPEEDEDEVEEGRLLYRQHRVRERNRKVIEAKKKAALAGGVGLACEVCGFDFQQTYGELGKGFVECHHLIALSDAGVTKTKASDLALLCSNCHRMAHRKKPWPTLDELRALIGGSPKRGDRPLRESK